MRQTIALPPHWSPLVGGSSQVVAPPAGPWPFPTLSLHPLRRLLRPYPAVSPRCLCPVHPGEHRPRARGYALGRRNHLCHATSTESTFRACSHSLRFKLPRSLGPQVAPTADTIVSGRPGRLPHPYSRAVARTGWPPARCAPVGSRTSIPGSLARRSPPPARARPVARSCPPGRDGDRPVAPHLLRNVDPAEGGQGGSASSVLR
jgi:hypothetical protein